ncbi:MAG TPA: hypothetical protein VFW65_31835 [Pseudonocardiaceae bacterium]|nr:hypothetical protein [Pseudonocardiaceae bacterium]
MAEYGAERPALEPVLTWRRDTAGNARLILADFGYGVSVQGGMIHLREALPTPPYARRVAVALTAAADWVESTDYDWTSDDPDRENPDHG